MKDKYNTISFLNNLRKRLLEYRVSKNEIHSAIIYDICAIELAINFLELRIVRDRKINKDEFRWFEGKRYIQDAFESDQEYNDIYEGYIKICELAKKLNK
jgi:hypothetical protein